MERRKAAATAGALTTTGLALVVAVGANFGLFGLTSGSSPVGRLDPVGTPALGSTTTVAAIPFPIAAPAPVVQPGSTLFGSNGEQNEQNGQFDDDAPTAPAAAPSTDHDSDDDHAEDHDDESDDSSHDDDGATEHDDD